VGAISSTQSGGRAATWACFVFAGVCAVGCSGVLAKGDGRAIGDDLGRFGIDATLDDNTCGAGADGATNDVMFDVFLSEAPPRVYWNSGADSVEGDLDEDGVHFTFESETVVAIPSDVPAADTCTIVRTDTSSGAFDHATRVHAFTGSLEYHYAAQGRSDCATAMASQGFTALPCTVRYTMAGSWISSR
jgi:hypothetical protein